jgi:hypothetical protein
LLYIIEKNYYMKFYIVFCKNKKKFDKFVKLNRIRNKVIIDIKKEIELENIDVDKYRDYFNVVIYTKISQSFKKGKDVYYIPNFSDPDIKIENVCNYKNMFNEFNIKYMSLIFIKDFQNPVLLDNVLNTVQSFDSCQIIEDY